MTDILSNAGRLLPETVFIHAGANIGTHTAYALLNGRFARAISCEPEPKNLRLLEMNMAANGHSSRVRVVPRRAAEPLTALASCDGITDILVF